MVPAGFGWLSWQATQWQNEELNIKAGSIRSTPKMNKDLETILSKIVESPYIK